MVYPLSGPKLVAAILEGGADPNRQYRDLARKQRKPWLLVLDDTREAQRRGWICYYETTSEMSKQWYEVMRLFVKLGADLYAVLVKTSWGPEASALDVVEAILEKVGSGHVSRLRDLLVETGAIVRCQDQLESIIDRG